MSEPKELTYEDVSSHNSKKDLYLVIHDKVYNTSSFVDEHPGGEEVLLDMGGQDATEAFEDVGHSDEAREILTGLLIGDLKRTAEDPPPLQPPPSTTPPASKSDAGGMGSIMLYAVILVGGLVAFGAYQFMQAQPKESQ